MSKLSLNFRLAGFRSPLSVDPDNYDFRLKENSPAFTLGFKPIDMEHVGLDGKSVGPVY